MLLLSLFYCVPTQIQNASWRGRLRQPAAGFWEESDHSTTPCLGYPSSVAIVHKTDSRHYYHPLPLQHQSGWSGETGP